MPATNFSYDGVHVFLTYPQCSLEREELRDRFLELAPDAKFYIARELHGDGNPHLHAYVHFGGRRRFTSADCFDVAGYHPNIQKPRSAKHVVEYCAKEDDSPLANFTPGSEPTSSGWAQIVSTSETSEQFFDAVRQLFPRDYVLAHGRLVEYCAWKYGRDETPYSGRGRECFREPAALTQWIQLYLDEVCILSCLLNVQDHSGGPQSPPSLTIILA